MCSNDFRQVSAIVLHVLAVPEGAPFPTPLSSYPPASADGLWATLVERVAIDPFNAIATALFVAAIVHTFSAAWFTTKAHSLAASLR